MPLKIWFKCWSYLFWGASKSIQVIIFTQISLWGSAIAYESYPMIETHFPTSKTNEYCIFTDIHDSQVSKLKSKAMTLQNPQIGIQKNQITFTSTISLSYKQWFWLSKAVWNH